MAVVLGTNATHHNVVHKARVYTKRSILCRIFVWYGRNCKNVLKSKARLMAERINKNERKSKVGASWWAFEITWIRIKMKSRADWGSVSVF